MSIPFSFPSKLFQLSLSRFPSIPKTSKQFFFFFNVIHIFDIFYHTKITIINSTFFSLNVKFFNLQLSPNRKTNITHTPGSMRPPWLGKQILDDSGTTSSRPHTSTRESKIRSKLRAAAYAQGGIDWKKLFHHYDRNNKGTLDYVDFRSAVRRDGKMNATTLHDKDLQLIFQKVDYDGSGEIDLQEFTAWLENDKTNNNHSMEQKDSHRGLSKHVFIQPVRSKIEKNVLLVSLDCNLSLL